MNLDSAVDVFIKDAKEIVLRSFKTDKKLEPQLWVFFNMKTTATDAKLDVTVFPIISEAINDQYGKDIIEEGIIELLASMNHVGLTPICVLWTTEAWVRMAPMESLGKDPKDITMKDVENVPKKEAIMMVFETDTFAELACHEILDRDKGEVDSKSQTNGRQPVNKHAGRFSNFIQKMKEYEW